MAIRDTGFKWYDGCFLFMIAFSVVMVAWSWKQYDQCELPIHMWIVLDYTVVFIFRLLMFVDNSIVASVGLETGWHLRGKHLYGRVLLLCITYGLLYPFLWVWTIVGTVWFATNRDCLPEKNQIWGYLIWLLFSFSALICLAGIFVKKWLIRRRAHFRRSQRGTRVSEVGVLINMICQPNNLVYEATAREMRNLEQEATAHNPRIEICESVLALVETLIQRLPIYILRAIPTDCSDCPICLEEFRVGQEVRGLPCAHNFHVACIDKWLRLNMRCPRCRCMVFPVFNRNNTSTVPVGPDQSTVPATQPLRMQPCSASYFARMQSFLMPVRADNNPLPLDSTSSNIMAPPLDSSPNQSPTSTSSNSNAPPCDSSPSMSPTPTSNSSDGPSTALEIVEKEGEASEPVE